jgi:hypothetical protein
VKKALGLGNEYYFHSCGSITISGFNIAGGV